MGIIIIPKPITQRGWKNSGKLPEPQDEYISSEKSGKKPMGLYRIGQDENGNRKIFFDDPKADHANRFLKYVLFFMQVFW